MDFSPFYHTFIQKPARVLWFMLAVFLLAIPSPVQAQTSPIQLSKTIDGNPTNVETGEIIFYRITFECSSLTGPCGALELTDVLPAGLTYLPPPQSAVPSGFTITYNAGTRTITITKDDNNFLDGTQFDAVIAVRVNYDFRPLPAIINNTISGRVDPPGPGGFLLPVNASAPPVTVDPVTENWELSKTLYSPAVNPTVDTDVTYRVSLCPLSPTGNVALQGVVITDTLPPGAVFVSASNGGTESGGVVTWNIGDIVLDPVTAATCIDRFVTVRYPTPTFTAGVSVVTNTATANGSYTDSTGGVVGPVDFSTTPINHPIDTPRETPDYSKTTAGNPVGINGTGRFRLNIDTSSTNVAVADAVLIDNIPPQLRVTEVTSGTWSAAFSNVRAFVEYSTNNGGSWTLFPGTNPVSFNSDVTYPAPGPNITNVRWRFEYDDPGPPPVSNVAGLPFTFSFTGQPEIRFTPRVAPDPTGFPLAVPGDTYTNCVQVSRTGLGGPVTDPCFDATVTIQQDRVSLRVSKAETPGAGYDPLDDPNIDVFIPDATILAGDTLRYVITVDVTERSSIDLFEPTIRDTIPAGLIFVRNGTARLDGVAAVPQPAFSQAGQILTWSWAGTGFTVPRSTTTSRLLTVEFFARIPPGQTPGAYTNTLEVVTNSSGVVCEIGTTVEDSTLGDIDGDGDPTDPACQNPDQYLVERSAALRGEKWIRSTDASLSTVVDSVTRLPDPTCPSGGTTGLTGGGSNTFTRFPCVSQAFPEGALSNGQLTPPPLSTTLDDFEYNLRIFNDGNVGMSEYVLYDILPFYNDRGSGGTLANTPRLSEFQPSLRGPVQFLSGPGGLTAANFTIEYNPSTNPCRPEVFNQPAGSLVPAGCNNSWSPVFSTAARAFRIRFNTAPGAEIPATASTTELRFGVPMNIPADVPALGVLTSADPQSGEIAWNSFSHTGAYLDLGGTTRRLLASEPRKVGITIPERLSVGNRVWRDADNSGTINAPDDTNPGIANVTINLYQDYDNNGVPDGGPIAVTTTDANGYYLFSNIVPDGINRYIIGIPASNFNPGGPLENLRSSTGPGPALAYVNPPEGTADSDDNGIDPTAPGQEVFSVSFTLVPNTEPTGETDLSTTATPPATRDGPFGRGSNGEQDNDSDLRFDFGFFSQVDLFSIGNRVWRDDGSGGGIINNGIMDGGEPPIAGVRVELYRDGNANGQPDPAEFMRFDITDPGGYYLFDQLDPGTYFVVIPASNFDVVTGVLRGLNSSQPTGTELVGVPGNPSVPNMDRDDNGINAVNPPTTGVRSGVIVLAIGTAEPTGETDLSGQPDPDGDPSTPNLGNNPTEWDGPGSIGRYGEDDDNSNVTIDFGFIPPLSIGNRVWLDNGATASGIDFDNYNDGVQNGTEVGIANVALSLFYDANDDGDFLDPGENTAVRTTTTNASGYYLFDGLQPGNYQVRVNAGNFSAGQPLANLVSSFGNFNDITTDVNDNGIDDVNYLANGIFSNVISLRYGNQPATPANETDIPPGTPANIAAYGANLRGRFGEADLDSNLTMDFGFVNPPFNLGNRVWLDNGAGGGTPNDGIQNGTEPGIAGVTVRLLDSAGNPINDPNTAGVQDYIVTTDANGYYRFDNLPAGDYIVEIAASNFVSGTGALFGRASSTGAAQEANPNSDVDRNDNGLDTPVSGAIRSGAVTLGPGSLEPVAPAQETDIPAAGPFAGQGPGPDNRANMTVDFGFYDAYSLGNRVWLDDNNSGDIDAGDGGAPGIANVTVRLLTAAGTPADNPNLTGTQDYTLVTDANGYYRFDNLPAGDYIVEIAASNFVSGTGALFGFSTSTGAAQEANPNNNADSNDNGLDTPVSGAIRSGTVTLGPGNVEPTGEPDVPGSGAFAGQGPTADDRANMTVDFGFYRAYTLGNRVWADLDNSGHINGVEPGIAGVTVRLLDTAGNPVDNPNLTGTQDYTLVTDGSGYYRFDNLPAGDYIVEVAASNFVSGTGALFGFSTSTGAAQEANPNNDADSNDNGLDTPVSGAIRSGTVTLGPGNVEPTGEPDVPGSGAFAGQGPTVDGRANMTVDFGFYRSYSLGNRIWLDDGAGGGTPNDGIQNGTEPGIAGVTVRLLDTAGNPVDNPNLSGTQDYVLTTDANGYYRFDNLPAGDYVVEIQASNFNTGGPLSGRASSTGAGQEANPNSDVDRNDNGLDTPVSGAIRSGVVTLGPGGSEPTAPAQETDIPAAGPFAGQGPGPDNQANMTVDFGFYDAYSLGNRVWLDDNNSGDIDAGDGGAPGIANVTVRLLDTAGSPVDNPNLTGTQDYTLVTDANGYYRFDNLPAGDYIVEIAASNFVSGTGALFGFASSTGAAQEANPNNNADSNDNGLDTPVAGAIRSGTVTLGPGNVEPTGEPDVPGSGAFAGQGPTVDGRANMTVDFGFYRAYTLGNRVWADLDNSGHINGADTATPGIANVTVRLLDTAGSPVDNPNLSGTQDYTLVTDASGYYRFDNLPAGDYIVEVAAANFAVGGPLQAAVSSTGAAQEANPNNNVDSNDNGLDTPVSGAIRSGAVTLGPGNVEPTGEPDVPGSGAFAGQGPTVDGRANMTLDFGFVPRFSLGNRVWLDDGIGGGGSNDGLINGAEAGIAGVQVQLLDSAGNPADDPSVAGTQPYIVTTDASGYYRFDNLPAGDYIVEIIASNFAAGNPLQSLGSSTGAEANPNADVDNNDNGIDSLPATAVRSGVVTLGPGYNEPLVAAEPDIPAAGPFAGQGAVDGWANMTVDFGFVRLFSLGNRVWRDDGIGGGTLNDGIQNGSEAGISGVVVRLLNTAGTPVDNPNIAGVQDYTVTTSPQGYYRFDNLPPGDYIVEIVSSNFTGGGTLANFFSSNGAGQEANPNNNVDANDNGLDVPVGGAIRSGMVTLGPAADEPTGEDAPFGQGGPDLQANMTVDFGFVPGSYSLGNRVWLDTDNSGTINGGEAGVDGVTVRLLNSAGTTVLGTTTTANGGYYRFDNLAAGNYIVEVAASSFGVGQPLNGLVSSTGPGQEANPNTDGDNNDNGIDTPFSGAIRSGTVTLGPGDSEPTGEPDVPPAIGQGALDSRANMTVDFGFTTPTTTYSLGNRVWFDADNDGTMNAFDGPIPGIGGVTVNLLNMGGAVVATTTTDAQGYYRFDNLAAGDYIVEIAASNFSGAGVLLNLVSSSGPGQEANPNSDIDRNDNGLDVPVGGAIRSGTVTLGPGATEPTGETDVSASGQGAADNQANMTVDFGFTNATNVYSLGNRVWRDNGAGASRNNGRQDAGEAGVANVTVNLLDSSGTTIIATTTTDAQGYYRFDNLPAGDYRVEIAASNFSAGQPLEGTTSSTGSFQEADPNNDVDRNDNGLDIPVAGAIRSGVVTLGPGASEPTNETDLAPSGQGAPNNRANMTVDFGFTDSFSLGNRIWLDNGAGGGTANNGIQDGTEPGIGGVAVRLLDSTGSTVLATTTTDVNGYYRFDNLIPGTYVVEVTAANFAVGNPLNSLISSAITNANPNSDIDLDDNGLDTPVNGAIRSGQVTLGPTANEPTGETDLGPGNQGPVPDNRANMTVDFGFAAPTNAYSLGNRVWLDNGVGGGTANDGIQNGTEIGMVGVSVNLLDSTGTIVLATTVTDAGGYYRFDGLAAGSYFVEIPAVNFAINQPLNGLLSSAVTNTNPNSDIDRDDNGLDAPPGGAVRSGVVTLGPGDSEPLNETDLSSTGQGAPDERANMTVDFGFAAPATTYSLGNRVWFDADNDGTLNGAETGIAGVSVRLLDSTGTTIVATTTTDANGYYRFDNLAEGSYIVEIASTNFTAGQVLEGLASSSGAGQEANPNSDGDSNDNGLDTFVNGAIRSGVVTLGPGASEPTGESDLAPSGQGAADNQANMTVDFGFTSSYSLGNRVWFDTNNNRILDAGERGIPGVRVELYRDTDGSGSYTPGTDTLINFVTTDGNGYYLFTGLAAADYVVVIPVSNFDNAGDPLRGYYSSGTSRNPANGQLIEIAAPDPDDDADNDDNGTTSGTLGTATGYVASQAVSIGPGAVEPTGEPDPTSPTFPDSTPDNRSNLTVDFGFYTMTLGNLVWFDADNNGVVNSTEAGLDGVTLQLYAVGSDLNGPPLAITTTLNGGQYSFPDLAAGDYIVRIPASNFTGVLAGFTSSTGGVGNPYETPPGVDPNNGTDSDDNGVHTAGPASPVISPPITLTPGGLSTITDNATGRSTNNTLDFGLISSAPLIYSLGNRVFLDFDNNGIQDAGEPGIGGVQVRLLDSSGSPYDTDPNTAGVQEYIVTTDSSGYYRFDNLPAGDYIVQIMEVNFNPGGPLENYNSSGTDELLPNNDIDRNDNGIGTTPIAGTGIISGVVTLGPTEPTGETDLGTGGQGAADSRANMTVDFGFTPPAGLIITKDDGLNAVVVGATTTYTVNIFNNTGVDQTNVQFLDDVPTGNPEGFDPASVSWTCTSTPAGLCPNASGTNANISELIPTIPDGGRVVYRITGRVRPCQTGCGVSITNLARLGTGEQDDDVNGIISDPPRGSKTGTVIEGTRVRWQMVWFSTADPARPGQAVIITDTLQAGQTFAGNLTCQANGTSVQVSCTFVNGAVIWEGIIVGGTANSIIISFDVTVPGPGDYENSAILTEPGTNIRVSANARVNTAGGTDGGGQALPPTNPPINPIITVTPNPPFGSPGSSVDWNIDVTNPNGFPLDNVVITVVLPDDLQIVGVDAPPGAIVVIDGNIVIITIPTLPPGAYPTIVIHTTIKPNVAAPFVITVTASLNVCPCSASGSVTSVTQLPETGEPPRLPFNRLVIALSVTAGAALLVAFVRRKRAYRT